MHARRYGFSRRAWAGVLLWVVPAVWSSNYLIARTAAPLVPPHLLAFGRWSIVVALLLAMGGRTLFAQPRRLRGEWRRSLVLGALGMWICGAWVYIGGRSTSATHIGLIYAAAPVGIALGGQRLLGEPLAAPQRWAMAMALAGVLFIVLRGDPDVLLGLRFSAGDLWVVAATVSWIAYSLLLKAWPTELNTSERLAANAAGGLLCLAPFAACELATLEQPIGAAGYGLMALAGLLPGLFSYLAYSHLQRELGVARAALVLYLAPLYGALLAWALLGEAPQWYHAVGAALILPGLRFAGRRSPR